MSCQYSNCFHCFQRPQSNGCVFRAADQRVAARDSETPDGRCVVFEHCNRAKTFVARIDWRHALLDSRALRLALASVVRRARRQHFQQLFVLRSRTLRRLVQSLGVRVEFVHEARKSVGQAQQSRRDVCNTLASQTCCATSGARAHRQLLHFCRSEPSVAALPNKNAYQPLRQCRSSSSTLNRPSFCSTTMSGPATAPDQTRAKCHRS